MKKKLGLLLVVCVIFSALTGCFRAGKPSGGIPIPGAEETASPSPAVTDITAALSAARDARPADEVVMTVNGIDVAWSEYFYWLSSQINSYYNYYGTLPDWEAAGFDGTTMDENFRSIAENSVRSLFVIETKARDMGIELSAESKAEMDKSWQSIVDGTGGEEAAQAYLESNFLTKDIFYHFTRVSYLYRELFNSMFGENGEKISENDVLSYAADAGYMRVKHILFRTLDDEGKLISESERAEKKSAAESVLTELRQLPEADREAEFDEKMNPLSEDPGLSRFPDGYTFLPGEMIEVFETAASGLSEGEISEIVESDAGYHIILRLPLDPGSASVHESSSPEPRTLRNAVAGAMFSSNVDNWMDEAVVAYADNFKDFRVSSLFN